MDIENSTVFENAFLDMSKKEVSKHTPIRDSTAIIAIYATTLILLSISGVIGNVLILFAVSVTPRLRTVINVFIVNLAASDLLVCLLVIPFTVLSIVDRGWPLSLLSCYLIAYLYWMLIITSFCTLALIAASRFCLITKSHQMFMKYFHTKMVTFYIAGIWIQSVALIILMHFGLNTKVVYDSDMGICATKYNSSEMFIFSPTTSAVCLFICFVAIPGLYLRTLHVIHKGHMNALGAKDNSPDQENARAKRKPPISKGEIQMTKLSLLIFVLFAICWAPLLIIAMLSEPFPEIRKGM